MVGARSHGRPGRNYRTEAGDTPAVDALGRPAWKPGRDAATLAAACGERRAARQEAPAEPGPEGTTPRAPAVGVEPPGPAPTSEGAALRPTSEVKEDFLHKQVVFVAAEKGAPVRGPHATPRPGDQAFSPHPPLLPMSMKASLSQSVCLPHTHTHTRTELCTPQRSEQCFTLVHYGTCASFQFLFGECASLPTLGKVLCVRVRLFFRGRFSLF